MKAPPFFFPRPDRLARLRWPEPPAWLVDECHNRLVLLLNHILQQEPAAMERLRRQCGKTVELRWGRDGSAWSLLPGPRSVALHISPVGLLERGAATVTPDLVLTLDEPSPWTLADKWMAASKPNVVIEGDVQLAADVAWLIDNVRWEIEEDLARLLGDAPAHALVQAGRRLAEGLRRALIPALQAARARAQAWRAPRSAAPVGDPAGGAAS